MIKLVSEFRIDPLNNPGAGGVTGTSEKCNFEFLTNSESETQS